MRKLVRSFYSFKIKRVDLFHSFKIYFFVLLVLVSTKSIAQFPAASSCTSKDLELVGATVSTDNACFACTAGTPLNRHLVLAINNTTGSTRTSFAFWGTLEITHADNTVSTYAYKGCAGPIIKNSINSVDFGVIPHYVCGDALRLTNLFLAWTAASGTASCPLDSSLIAPKCGTLPSIEINAGVNGSFSNTNVTCFGGATGAINLTPFGGTPFKSPKFYTYSWSTSNGSIPAGQSTNQDLTGLTAGTYTVRITDSLGCYIDKNTTVTGPSAGLALGTCSKTDVTCFGGTNGSVTAGSVTNSVGTVNYTWKKGATTAGTTATVNGLSAGTYDLTVTDNCSSKTCSVTIGGPSAGLALGTCSKTDESCAGNDGSVTAGTVTNAVGTIHYTWKKGANTVGSTATVNGLAAGTYDLTVTDDCSSKTCSVTVGAPATITTPAATVTQQPTCSIAKGTVTVTSPDGTTTYKLTQGGVVKYTAVSGVFNSVDPGTYLLTATIGICSKDGNNVTVNPQPATPGAPALCILQQVSLCGSATGSIRVTSPTGAGYQYSKDNGANWQTSTDFTGLAAGSNPSIIVKNADGCISGATSCSSASSSCPSGITQAVSNTNESTISETTVKAYPNPFSDRVKFVVTSPVAGKGNLEVYNMMGQRVKTVYQGFISAGTQTFEMSLPTQQIANLVYVLRIGDKKMSGKILQINQ